MRSGQGTVLEAHPPEAPVTRAKRPATLLSIATAMTGFAISALGEMIANKRLQSAQAADLKVNVCAFARRDRNDPAIRPRTDLEGLAFRGSLLVHEICGCDSLT